VTELQREIATRKQVEEMLFQRNRELILLNQLGQALSSTLDVDQVLVTLMDELRRLLNIPSSSVWLVDAGTNELVCRHAVGLQSEVVRGWRLPLDVGVSGWVINHGQSLMLPDAQADERHYTEIDQKSKLAVHSMLCVPLKTRGNVIGVLNVVDTAVNRFATSDKTLLELLANSAAIAIDNAGLVAALRQQTAELQSRNEELDAFAHTVAHDLKGPLGPLIGYAEILEKDHDRLPGDEVRDYLHTISASTQKMNNIIEELLLLAEARQSQVEIGPLDMQCLIAESLKRLGPMIEEYQAEISCSSSWPTVLGYGPWVEEVWVNYISNAIKYGGQPPCVELGATTQSDSRVCFWVRDNGAGITPEAQARLFTPFTRLAQARAKGHGLGLSIVRRIVEKLGGQVGVESDATRLGSVFSFALPSADSERDPENAGV
jgi:signal transduction histidine kinase